MAGDIGKKLNSGIFILTLFVIMVTFQASFLFGFVYC